MAALAAVGAASAQSSVEIYGRLDLGYASTTDNASSNGTANKTKSTSFGDQNGRTTSRLGFKGTEDLGGGLKASFNYEVALAPDDTARTGSSDTRSGFGTTRLANLNLSGGFGTVTLGTFLNTFDTVRGGSAATFSAAGGDFLATHAGNLKFNSTLGYSALDSKDERITLGIGARSTNSIAWSSPKFNGFGFGVGTVQDKSTTSLQDLSISGTAQTDGTGESKTAGYILSADYASGPLKVVLAHGTAKLRVDLTTASSTASNIFQYAGATQNKVTDTALLLAYDLGFVAPYFQYETIKHTFEITNGAGNGDNLKTAAYEIGAKFPMGAFTPFVTVGRGSLKATDGPTGVSAKVKTSAYQIGTTYDLSKRTYLHAAYGQFKAKEEATTDNFKRTGYKVGLVHQF